jgi:serine/threonine protein kinase
MSLDEQTRTMPRTSLDPLKHQDPEVVRRLAEEESLLPEIPDYQRIRKLGKGGFGEVWLCRSLIGVHRAVKYIRQGTVSEVEFEGMRNFETRVGRHPNLIDIRHAGEVPGWLYYVMDLADGYPNAPTFDSLDYEPRTVAGDLRRRGHLGVEEAAGITLDILSGLTRLHEAGLLHRDIKPGNLLFVDGMLKLGDIGLVVRQDQSPNSGCTPGYAPPEGVIDKTGDLYCLGRTLYEMATGLKPERFPEWPEDFDEASQASLRRLMAVLDRACAPESEDRFQTTEQFRLRLQSIARRPPRLRGWVVAAGTLLLSVLILLGVRSGQLAAKLPISGSLVLSRVTADGHRSPIDERTIPLRAGDLLAVQVKLDSPAYPLVAILVASEPGEVIYPEDVKAQLEPVRAFELPAGRELGLPDEPVTLILLAQHQPFSFAQCQSIQERLASIEQFPQVGEDEIALLDRGDVEIRAQETRGSRRAGLPGSSDDHVREAYRLIYETFQDYPFVWSITLPQLTLPPEDD